MKKEKNLSPTRNRTPAVQPVAHRYTDCSIPTLFNIRNWLNYTTEHSLSREVHSRCASQGIPAFYGTQKFTAAFSSSSHCFIFCATSLQPTFPIIHFNITLNYT
jgi:hypothetical protein